MGISCDDQGDPVKTLCKICNCLLVELLFENKCTLFIKKNVQHIEIKKSK